MKTIASVSSPSTRRPFTRRLMPWCLLAVVVVTLPACHVRLGWMLVSGLVGAVVGDQATKAKKQRDQENADRRIIPPSTSRDPR